VSRRLSSVQPIFHVQIGDLLKIAEIGGMEERIVNQGDGGDPQVHGCDPHFLAAQVGELVGRCVVERQPRPSAEVGHHVWSVSRMITTRLFPFGLADLSPFLLNLFHHRIVGEHADRASPILGWGRGHDPLHEFGDLFFQRIDALFQCGCSL
jgi:hypothetical protein